MTCFRPSACHSSQLVPLIIIVPQVCSFIHVAAVAFFVRNISVHYYNMINVYTGPLSFLSASYIRWREYSCERIYLVVQNVLRVSFVAMSKYITTPIRHIHHIPLVTQMAEKLWVHCLETYQTYYTKLCYIKRVAVSIPKVVKCGYSFFTLKMTQSWHPCKESAPVVWSPQ